MQAQERMPCPADLFRTLTSQFVPICLCFLDAATGYSETAG